MLAKVGIKLTLGKRRTRSIYGLTALQNSRLLAPLPSQEQPAVGLFAALHAVFAFVF
jgi:hypothetical protein